VASGFSRTFNVTTITTESEGETEGAGRELAATLSAGDVLLLYGDLGAGKTAFVRGLAEGLGVHRDEVSSPTFTLVRNTAADGCRCFTSISIGSTTLAKSMIWGWTKSPRTACWQSSGPRS